MKTKKELGQFLKTFLNTNRKYEEITGYEFELLSKLFYNYYQTCHKEGRTNWHHVWNNIDELDFIKIVHNPEENAFKSLCYELHFKNGIIERPSYIKAIGKYSKKDITNL